MQPQPVLERHLVFKPLPPLGINKISKGSGQHGPQQQELQKTRQMLNVPLSYIQLVGVVQSRTSGSHVEKQASPSVDSQKHDTVIADTGDESKQSQKALQWSLDFKDIPDPGKMSTTSRAISKTQILDGDPIQFLKDLGYEYTSQYVITGDKFYDQATTLFLHRVMQISDHASPDAGITFSTVNTIPDISKLHPLDSSGGYILQASIEIADGNSPDLKDKATQQLLALKETLRSIVHLEPGDRLALDTRVPVRRVR